jgi:hypothetical protein
LLCLFLAVLLCAACRSRSELSAQDVANYAHRISFSNFRLRAEENLVGHTVYYIRAVVKNNGDRSVTLLVVDARFRDTEGQVALKEPVTVISDKFPPVGPGQSREFQMGFESVPASWNRNAPELTIARLTLE